MSIEQRIMEQVMEQCGKDVTVEYVEVEKQNGCVRKGYRLMEVGSTLAPTIYFDERDSEDEIVEHTVEAYSNALKSGVPDEELIKSQFTKENVLEKVYPVFVNIEKSKGMLEQVVNCHYLADIAITYRIDVDMGNGTGSVVITNKHLETLEISKDELCDNAISNIQGKAEIIPMSEMFGAETPLVIITNSNREYGASMILDKEIAKTLKEKVGEAFIIPSSIHEVILCPTSDDENDVKYLIDMIKAINATEVQPEDFLSDNLFKFNGEAFEKVEV